MRKQIWNVLWTREGLGLGQEVHLEMEFLFIFGLSIITWLLFRLHTDRNARSLLGERNWSRQSAFMFVDGVILVLAVIGSYILIKIVEWAWIHLALQK